MHEGDSKLKQSIRCVSFNVHKRNKEENFKKFINKIQSKQSFFAVL